MKNLIILRNLSFVFVVSLLFFQCAKEEFDPVIELIRAPEFSTPGSGAEYVLLESEVSNVVTNVSWSSAHFGFAAGVEYTLEMDVAGNSFAEPVTLTVQNAQTYKGLTVAKLNGLMIAKELPDGVATDMEFRVCGSVSDDQPSQCSKTIIMKITPFKSEIDYPKLNVPGSYQGWAPDNFNTVIYSLKSDEVYEGYVFMTDENTNFKYAKGSWDTNWGDTGADGTLDPGGDNINFGSNQPGMYFLKANLNTLTHQYTRTDWGLIGSATPTGWDSDTDMVWNAERSVLTITMDLVAGAIKFRANDDWGLNYGDTDANGSLEAGGDDIVIDDPGNYTIDLDLDQPGYTYTLTKN